MKKLDRFTVIDLFSGCGGLSLGFLDAGYDIVLGVDHDKSALETFRINHKNSKTLNLDLSDKNAISSIRKALEGKKIDIIVAGPPCQGFSLTGTRNFDDKRNQLYLSVIEAIKKFKPKAFLIENVPGLSTLYGGKVRNEIISRLKKAGYNVESKILCAADYGVPQLRKRVVFVGAQKKFGNFIFPDPTHNPKNYVSCLDAIGDLPGLENCLGSEERIYPQSAVTSYQKNMRKGTDMLYNHTATNHSALVKSVISLVPEGGNYKNLPPGIGKSRTFHVAWTRYHSQKPSKTIDTGHRNHFHYKYDRIPTVRENARLQSFPDIFRFTGTRTQQYRQVGNAVPPILGYHLGKKIMSLLNNRNDEKIQ
ncbi:MAG: DNA cytosine methyltransferase [Elusimicrobiota bacterium]